MIDKTKFNEILDINDPDFAEDFAKALNLKDGETLEIITPQFNRTDGRAIAYLPNTPEEYAAFPRMSEENLKKIGCQIWGKEGGETTWLYPAEWYDHIPNGTPIVDICGEHELFERGKTDDDRRFGALSFGFIQ